MTADYLMSMLLFNLVESCLLLMYVCWTNKIRFLVKSNAILIIVFTILPDDFQKKILHMREKFSTQRFKKIIDALETLLK